MRPPRAYRVYIDTSVVGAVHDDEFAGDTSELFARFASGEATAVLSPLLFDEVAAAPTAVQETLRDLAVTGELLDLSEEAERLRDAYLAAAAVPRRWADDALHVAYATTARVDAIVSWNFRHLVNARRIRSFSAVNLTEGYGMVVILSPADAVRMVEAERDDEE